MAKIEQENDMGVTEMKLKKWINVKDKVPDRPGQFLVTTEWFGVKRVELLYYGDISLSNIKDKFTYFKCKDQKYVWYMYDSNIGDIPRFDVIAWMWLPKPF